MKTGVIPNAHEKAEWSRLARAAYRAGLNKVGHRYSTAAALIDGLTVSTAYFDMLQSNYRRWLNDGVFPSESD